MDVIMNDTNKYKPIVNVAAAECEAKDLLHVEVQDLTAHRIGVNTISEVDDVVVSEPQVDEVDVVDTCVNRLKVDFEKAYDSVRWDFIDDILRRFGFGEKWCLFNGIKLDSSLQISHLFYADDAIFMGQWSQCNIDIIIRVLDVFYRAPGLRINMNKSNLMGISVDSNKVKHAAAKICCLVLKTSFNYLGSRVGDLMYRIQSWHDVTEGMHTRVVKALYCEDEKIGKKVQPRYPSTWLNIINEIESLKLHGIDLVSFITLKLGNGVNTSFWDVAWSEDIAFKNLVPRLYALESMKNIEVASKLSHGGLEFSFRRNPRGVVEQSQFERLKEMVEGVTLSNSNDRWSWSLVGSGDFCRCRRHLFFSCKMKSDVIRKITRWWDLEYREINFFEDWCHWILSIRLPVKQKHVFEGICYIVWWYTWNWRNLKIFDQEDYSMVNVYDEVVYRSFYWIRFRCKAKFSFIDWLKNPNLVL
nr:RNA-directed DNA polymerase, eukaryota, reverse transcriptase zinc-binding domain protein [Tanacetum cinerariifolium]GEX94426.1 RNA-directed DNA polymerase, eukaryota, reverse transcriptase zinc-binding domain protein [Tanacetum cinerariifolium]